MRTSRASFDNIDHDWLMRMLEQRIDDCAFLGLIRKWLKAGILEEDSKVILPVTGTPQGGVVSAVLANIYLHFVLDLWFEKIVKPVCDGDALLMRFADDYVCCFQYHRDLQKLRRTSTSGWRNSNWSCRRKRLGSSSSPGLRPRTARRSPFSASNIAGV